MLLYPECHSDCVWVWIMAERTRCGRCLLYKPLRPADGTLQTADLGFWCALLVLRNTPHAPCKKGWKCTDAMIANQKFPISGKHFLRTPIPSDQLGQLTRQNETIWDQMKWNSISQNEIIRIGELRKYETTQEIRLYETRQTETMS